ncbi:class I SAM-dependent methyltransferase [Tenggerimyces flavus]|uniref:Class I SAM-dependent methyltransferase n=1 Tax=Tenggerimyces flavus TaxID=1708749 RepID=A0ABV7YNG8_9ACTN|nr:methyltransferase domain-containing protein [Tenggerimyces flavus]MBM7789383.1 SAM-dependent methyltransferase [Tenggerimyces flavus]
MNRSAETYADFFLPRLSPEARVLDVGCGDGEITLGLAAYAGSVVGVDLADDFAEPTENVTFQDGSVYDLPFADGEFDAAFAHSMLEALERPVDGLAELRRVLRPGGVVGVASVEYSGLILAGPHAELLRRFYAIRERLWQLGGDDPYRGRELRGLLHEAGFVDVEATTKSIPYGTTAAVREFGRDRAAQVPGGYTDAALEHDLATKEELAEMERAWLEWGESPAAYLAFAWCRAVGVKP